jgi:hypothetical protein
VGSACFSFGLAFCILLFEVDLGVFLVSLFDDEGDVELVGQWGHRRAWAPVSPDHAPRPGRTLRPACNNRAASLDCSVAERWCLWVVVRVATGGGEGEGVVGADP